MRLRVNRDFIKSWIFLIEDLQVFLWICTCTGQVGYNLEQCFLPAIDDRKRTHKWREHLGDVEHSMIWIEENEHQQEPEVLGCERFACKVWVHRKKIKTCITYCTRKYRWKNEHNNDRPLTDDHCSDHLLVAEFIIQ